MMKKIIFKQTKQFNTIMLKFIFPYTLKDEDIAKTSLLPSLLVNTNEFYKDEKSFFQALINNYIESINCSFKRVGRQRFLIFTLIIPDEKTLEADFVAQGIKFFIDTIYHPNIDKDQFEPKHFNLKKTNLELKIKENFTNINFYNAYQLMNHIDTVGELIKTAENNPEQVSKLNPKETYQFYKQIVLEKLPYICGIGDVDTKYLNELLNELFQERKNNTYNPLGSEFECLLSPVDSQPKIIEETKQFNQSCLNYAYVVKYQEKNDQFYLQVIAGLLSDGASDLLMKSLRSEGKLVYHATSHVFLRSGLLLIEARIARQSKQLARNRIEKIMTSLQDEKIIEPLLEKLKENYRLELIRSKDFKSDAMSDMLFSELLKCDLTQEQEYEILKNIQAKDIVQFVKRLELSVIYFLEGDKDGN